jgi:hypothetical protein
MFVICGMTCKVRNVLTSSKEAENFFLLSFRTSWHPSPTLFFINLGRRSAITTANQEETGYGVREGTGYEIMDGTGYRIIF